MAFSACQLLCALRQLFTSEKSYTQALTINYFGFRNRIVPLQTIENLQPLERSLKSSPNQMMSMVYEA